MLSIKDLELIRHVADSGSLTVAARLLHMTQSAVSQRVSKLHARLGINLIERRDGTMQLTAAGQRVLAASKLITAELNSAIADISRLSRQQADELRIATQCYTCYRWLPFVISAMRESYPLLSVDVVPEATDTPYDALREDRVDIAIVSDSKTSNAFEERELFSDELFAVVSTSHELANEKYLDATQFSGQTLVLYTGDSHQIVDDILAPRNVTQFNIIQVRITEAIIELARSGQGIAVIAGWALDDIDDTEGLVAIRITKTGFKRKWRAIIAANRDEDYVGSFLDNVRTIGTTIQNNAWRKQLRRGLP